MTFEHRIRVRYGEVDAQQVVFNAHWFAYFDDALTHYFGHLGFDPQTLFLDEGGSFDVMLVKAVTEWRGAAGFDDEIVIEVQPSRLGNSSFDLDFVAKVDGEPRVTSTITYVSIVPGENRSQPIPDDVRAALESDG